MSVEIEIGYRGELQCEAQHGPSGSRLVTDAPVDNGGRGAAFSPTDLVATALGTCMLTIMGKVAERHGWDLRGTRVRVVKEMVADPLRRIGRLVVEFSCPSGLSDEQRQVLENAANACPVHKALHGQVDIPVTYRWA